MLCSRSGSFLAYHERHVDHNSVPPHHPSETSYAPAPSALSSTAVPAQTHDPHLSTEATHSYAPAGYHEAAYPMYNSQAFGMGMGLGNGMAVEPSYEMGIAGGYNMANFGGFDASMNAGIGGGVDAGSYHTYGFQEAVDERTAYATHAPHFVQQQPANVSIFPGFEFSSSTCLCVRLLCQVPRARLTLILSMLSLLLPRRGTKMRQHPTPRLSFMKGNTWDTPSTRQCHHHRCQTSSPSVTSIPRPPTRSRFRRSNSSILPANHFLLRLLHHRNTPPPPISAASDRQGPIVLRRFP